MTDLELTAIYNNANDLDSNRNNPIASNRIFAAMRAAILLEREACAEVCEHIGESDADDERSNTAFDCAYAIRTRNNS